MFLLQKEQHRLAAESDSSSQSSMRPKWDTPLNRALNQLKGLPLDQRLQYGRVHGVGDGATWKHYYNESAEERKQRWRLNKENIDKKVEIAVAKKAAETKDEAVKAAVAAVKEQMAASYSAFLPTVIDWSKKNPHKEAVDFPLSDFLGSSSFSVAPAPAPATAPAHSSPSSISGVLGGASSLAELDALTVTTCHTGPLQYMYNLQFSLPFGCLTSQTCLCRPT
jgi:hypothetical protein